jgi:hypothetical protein
MRAEYGSMEKVIFSASYHRIDLVGPNSPGLIATHRYRQKPIPRGSHTVVRLSSTMFYWGQALRTISRRFEVRAIKQRAGRNEECWSGNNIALGLLALDKSIEIDPTQGLQSTMMLSQPFIHEKYTAAAYDAVKICGRKNKAVHIPKKRPRMVRVRCVRRKKPT